VRDPYEFNPIGEAQATEPTWVAANPPVGAELTYSVGAGLPADARLVMTISDDSGRQVRRLDLSKDSGVRRVLWNLRGDANAAAGGNGRGGGPGGAAGRGNRGGGAGAAGANAQGAGAQGGGAGAAGARGAGANAQANATPPPAAPPQAGGGRGGFGGGQAVEPGRYTAQLGLLEGDKVTAIGKAQSFNVKPLPDKNY
jgi:hypothetical protein